MILYLFVVGVFATASNGAGLVSPEYRSALTSMTTHISNAFKEEYLTYRRTGVETKEFKEMLDMFSPSENFLRTEVEKMSVQDQSFACTACRAVVSILLEYTKKGEPNQDERTMDDNIREVIVDLCVRLKIQPQPICEGAFDLNWPAIKYIFLSSRKMLTEENVCSVILQGSYCVTGDTDFDWTVNVDGKGGKVSSSKTSKQGSTKDDITILQLTDVHYDPLYEVGSLAACKNPMCCNAESATAPTTSIDSSESAGVWSDYRNCDVPWHMYTDSLRHIRQQHQDIEYVYYTGDVIDHGVWKTSMPNIKKSLRAFYREMKTYFGNTPVYPIVGNHESQPLNQFAPDYVTEEGLTTQWLYDFLAEEWSMWLPESALETIRKGGYYTVVPRKGFRVIALNNNDCYTFNWWLLHDPQYLSQQLQWLHDTLLEAEKAGEFVHILSHVPSGAGSCFNTWAREFRKVVERFHLIIGGIFNGHTHHDEFSVIYSSEKSKHAINVAWNGGSLTPFSFVNPNYRIYKVEPKSYQVVVHDTYIFNLTLANMTPEKSPVWFKEYSFAKAYGLKDMSPASLDGLLTKFAKHLGLLKKYWEYKMKSGDPSLAKGCDNDCLFDQLCEAATSQFNDMERCKQLEVEFLRTLYGGSASLSKISAVVVTVLSLVASRILF